TSTDPSNVLSSKVLGKIVKTIEGYIEDYDYIEGIHKNYLKNVVDEIERYIEIREEAELEYFNIWSPYVLASNYEQFCEGNPKLKWLLQNERADLVINLMRALSRGFSEVTEKLSILRGLTDKGEFQFKGKINKLIKTLWIQSLLTDKKIEFNEFRFKDKSSHGDITPLAMRLMNQVESIKNIKGDNVFENHENLDLIVNSLDECLSGENPLAIHFKNTKRYWTGRPDLILKQKDGNKIVIADYKPDYEFDGNPNKHFINGMAQLIGYVLIMQSQVDEGLEISCVMFNEKGEAIEFNPYDMLPHLKTFLNGDFIEWLNKPGNFEVKKVYFNNLATQLKLLKIKENDYNKALTEYKKINPKMEFANFFEDFTYLREVLLGKR
ncbi:MAG: hypothetical protein GF311_13390, partial [Candidatus Lokiarchaeota archaeon]|nr:hypothetical protein [Candidatus Lokiarchaeota archaeon]